MEAILKNTPTITTPSGHLLPSRVFAAPMAGYTDPPFCELMRTSFPNPPVLFTEMIDSHALIYRNAKTIGMLGKRDPQLFTQIAAGTPTMAEKAVEVLLDYETAGLNINMGCPAKKVVSCGGGSNLLRAPQTVKEICRMVRKKIPSLPFSVKFRSGWNLESLNYLEIGKIYQEEGVDFIMLHARTRTEAFGGRAHWDHIAHLKSELKIPVIANGDIVSYEAAREVARITHCDGFAIGRAAIGNPWLFFQVEAAALGKPPLAGPSPQERFQLMLRHFELIQDYYGPQLSSHVFRKHLVGYLKGLPGQKAIKEKVFMDPAPLKLERLEEILSDYFFDYLEKLGDPKTSAA